MTADLLNSFEQSVQKEKIATDPEGGQERTKISFQMIGTTATTIITTTLTQIVPMIVIPNQVSGESISSS